MSSRHDTVLTLACISTTAITQSSFTLCHHLHVCQCYTLCMVRHALLYC
jgi:hypothetical protein